jgi:hypothetical protein
MEDFKNPFARVLPVNKEHASQAIVIFSENADWPAERMIGGLKDRQSPWKFP